MLPRPPPPRLAHAQLGFHLQEQRDRIEQAAVRRDRRDLVLPSPRFKLILARPAELSVTTGDPVSTSRKLVVSFAPLAAASLLIHC